MSVPSNVPFFQLKFVAVVRSRSVGGGTRLVLLEANRPIYIER
jgi:hypothetical protein